MTELLGRLKGRDMVSTMKIAKKVNEVIDSLEEIALELVDNGVLTKENKKYRGKKHD